MSFQSPKIQTVPDLSVQRFEKLLDFLILSKVAPPPGISRPTYSDDSILLEVEVAPPPGFPIGQCWYNCIEHSLKNEGQIVYGWLFWEINYKYYVAQHHAIWRSENGALIDLTPNAVGAKKVLFMPDDRAPFDLNNLKAAMSLEWTSNDQYDWVARYVVNFKTEEIRSKEFGIMRMESDDLALTDRIKRLRIALS
jgi:hypothetical protein